MKAGFLRKFQSLKAKIVLLTATIIIVSNVIFGFIAYKTSKPALEKAIESNLMDASTIVSAQIISQNERIFNVLEALAEVSLLKTSEISLEEKNSILKQVRNVDDDFTNIAFYDKDGFGITDLGDTRDFSSALYFLEAKKGKRYIQDPAMNEISNNLLMFYSVPVYDFSHNFNGVIVAVVDGASLSKFCEKMVIGKSGHPIIISQKTGKTIGDAQIKYVEKEQNLSAVLSAGGMKDGIDAGMSGKTGITTFFEKSRKTVMIASYAPVGSDTSWFIFCMAPRSDYMRSVDDMLRIMILASFANIIVALCIGYVVVHLSINPLRKVQRNINEIATGNADLTKRISATSRDEVGEVVNGFNKFTEKLQTIVSEIKKSKEVLNQAGEDMDASAEDTAASISQILENISHVHNQIENQSSSVNQTASAMNEIMSNVESFDKMVVSQTSSVSEASSAVEEMIGNIASVNSSVEKMAESFEDLQIEAQNGARKQEAVNERIAQIEAQSELLQEANSAIASIASQTNLLAMNAAIEPAHAGDAGKGFSVVADEIRKLSETSTEQSATISQQLGTIMEAIKTVVTASSESSESFQNVSSKIHGTDELVRLIKNAMEEQHAGSQQVIDVLHQMNDSTLEVKSASAEMTEGNKAIMKEILNLQSATLEMRNSMENMAASARKIDETGSALNDITRKMGQSIDEIGAQIDQFKV